MELDYKIERKNDKELRLYLYGDIGMDLVPLKNLKEILDDLSVKPGTYLIIDFKNVKFISSNGISMIIRTYKRITQSNGKFEIYNMSPEIFSTFELLGLTEMVTVKYDESDVCEQIYNSTVDSKNKCPFCQKIVDSKAVRCPYCYKLIK